ncbi:MAG: tail fiber domain-containing protein [Candidatus Moraniibacteriota bacterium]|nr:MAG: tail fiber domain-containing protein [Candidatus Moranbacteria bacterium]
MLTASFSGTTLPERSPGFLLLPTLSISTTTLDLASSVNINTLQLGTDGSDGSFIIYSEQGATDYTTTFQPGAQSQNITYTLPNDDGTSGQVLITDGTGILSWTSAGSGGIGDITAIGDVASGDAFTASGTQGTSLYFYDADGRGQLTIANLSAARTYTLPDVSGTIATLNGGQTFTSATWNGSTVGVAYGGTGVTTFGGTNTLLYTTSANTLTSLATANSSILITNGSGVPSIATDIPTAVTIGSSYIYRAGGTDVSVADGGTGLSSYTAGDLLYASNTTTLAGLADIATGNVLLSGGVSSSPLWGKVVLGTHTTGNYVASATASGGLTMTGTAGGSLGILLQPSTDALSSTTSSGSGMELLSTGLSLLQGCSNEQVLSWNEASDVWECSDKTAGTSDWTAVIGTPNFSYLTDTSAHLVVGGSTEAAGAFDFDVTTTKLNIGAAASFDTFIIAPVTKGTTSHSGTLTTADLTTASRTWTLPDETGTICTTGSVCSGYQAAGSYLTTSTSFAGGDIASGTYNTLSLASSITRDTEWDTAAEINAATTDTDFAYAALSNLASVAINTSLISDTDNTDDLGSAAIGWKDIYSRTLKLDGSTSGTITLQAAATAGTNTITLPASTGTVALTSDLHSAVTFGVSSYDYLTLSGQEITLGQIDLTTDVTGTLPVGNGGTGVATFGGTNTLLYTSSANTLASIATANSSFLTTNGSGVPSFAALSADTFTQYALLAGRSGGQTIIGGTGAGDDLTFQTTSNGTKGSYIFSELGSGLVLSTSGTLSVVTNTLHTQNTDTGTDGTTFTVGDGTTVFTVDTSATNDTIIIEQGTYDSILSFTQPGAADQTYTFATGGTVCTTGSVCSGYQAAGSYLTTSTSFAGGDIASGTYNTLSLASSITRDTEWDTAAEINAATTDTDFAYAALSNLSSVAINTSLISDTDNTDDLGSAAIGWKDIYSRTLKLDGSTSGTITLQAAATAGTNTITLPASTGTVALTSDLHSAVTLSGSYDYITLSGQDIVRGQIDLTTDVTGTLPVGNGGTGAITFTTNGILYGNGTSAIAVTAAGTDTQILSNSSGTPGWINQSSISAGTLDGIDSLSFLRSDTSDSFTSGTLSFSDGTLLDLSSIAHDDSAPQGLKLPQNTTLTNIVGGGAGYIAYDTTANTVKMFNGTSWLSIGGASTTLQDAYSNDVDGSDATISLTTADDSLIFTNPSSSGTDSAFLLQLNQANTTAGVVALDIIQSSNNANAVNITANSIDTETGLSVTANALTTGTGLSVTHTTSVIANGGSLLRLSSSSVDTSTTTGTLLDLSSTGSTAGTIALITNNTASFTGITQSIVANGISSGTGLAIASSSAAMTGSLQSITLSGSNASNTGNLLYLNSSGANSVAKALNVAIASTGNFSTTGGVNFTFSGAHTGTGFAVSDATATGTAVSITANSISTGTGVSIASTSTAGGASGSSYLLNLSRSGANSNSSHTAYGIYSSVTNTGTSAVNYAGYFSSTTSGTTSTAVGGYFSASGGTTANYGLLVAAGSVGIGTTAPVSGLELYSSAASDDIFTLTSATATNDPLLKFRTGTTPAVQFSLGVDTSDSNTFKIDSNDGLSTSPDFKIDSTGQTTIANAVLGAQSFPEDAGIVSWVDMSVTSSSADNTVESYSAQIDSNPILTIYALSDGAGSIDNKGVGIGTTAPSYMLDVYDDTASDYAARFFNDGNNANRYGIVIQAGADDASGTTYYLNALDGDGGQVGYIANTSGTFALTDVSDVRTKTNIESTTFEGLDIINALRVVDFNRLSNPDGPEITGFIAQEVLSVYPKAVTISSSGYFGIAKSEFIPVIVKALQEEDSRVNSIETKVDTLFQGNASKLTSLVLETNSQATTLSGLKISVDEQFALAAAQLNAMSARLSTLETASTDYEARLAANETAITGFESRLATLEETNDALLDFYNAFELGNVLAKDTEGNLDLLNGRLRAKTVRTGALEIEIVDSANPTIGTLEILPVAKDEDGDGIDDWSKLALDDPEVVARDGKTAKVLTGAVTNLSRVFVNFVDNPGSTSWRERSRGGDGEYDGFLIHLAEPVSAPVRADWFLVEERDVE